METFLDLGGRVAVVTGGARGIGAEICRLLHSLGACIATMDLNREGVEALAAELSAKGPKAAGYGVNVADPAQVEAAAEAVLKDFGKVDVLVNNAGITRDNVLIRMTDEAWDLVLNVHLKGTFLMTRAFARPMLRARKGAIVNMASVVGIMGNAGQANYSAAKGGIIALTKTSAKEFAGRGIRVNAVAPGYIATDMTAAMSQEARDAMLKVVPLGRPGTVSDVASAVAFLASDRAGYITGQVLQVCGGMLM
ncbi:MAG: 3-oxoacyl-[acyl-carrier-protein] reductase [Planctomycetota bacterium]|nr:3-oxoacyl-[acyl-carrier-protein] reductase [Planctomycetota bacterium]